MSRKISQFFPRMLEVALSDVDRKLHFPVISALVMSVAKTNDRRNSGKMSAFEGLLAIASDKLSLISFKGWSSFSLSWLSVKELFWLVNGTVLYRKTSRLLDKPVENGQVTKETGLLYSLLFSYQSELPCQQIAPVDSFPSDQQSEKRPELTHPST